MMEYSSETVLPKEFSMYQLFKVREKRIYVSESWSVHLQIP